MDLVKFAIPTAIAELGMTVRDLFTECIRADVPGIPFRDASGKIVGKASMRHVLKECCIPQFMIRHARLLGDRVDALTMTDKEARQMLDMQVDRFILADMAVITPSSSMAKALAMMEKHDTTYLFIIDEKQQYHGTVSTMHVASRILELYG